jgi:hypothetical protein
MEGPYENRPTEVEVISLLELIFERDPSLRLMGREVRVGAGRYVVDLLLERNGTILFVEVKKITPQTASRINDVLEQLRTYRTALARQFPGREIRGVLAVTGVLAADKMSMLLAEGFEVWDRRWIIGHAMQVGLEEYAYTLFGEQLKEPALQTAAEIFQERVQSLNCGRDDWFAYQNLCGDILELLFCPPLNIPIRESSNVSRVNRRDFIIPNYVLDGFWQFMRLHYRADYVVVDAKNLCGQANKTHVLQMANYLSIYGTGLFGMIISRNGMNPGGTYICREQWMLHSKMIISLNDDDLLQMLESKKSGTSPEDVVRQKIEDFRLGM